MIFPLLDIIGKKNLIIMKNEKKKMVQNLDGYCPFELKAGLGVLGAGLGV